MESQPQQTYILKRVGFAAIILMQLLGGSIFVGLHQLLKQAESLSTILAVLDFAWLMWLFCFLGILAWLLMRRRWHDKYVFWWSFTTAIVSLAVMALVMTGTISV